MKRVRKEKQHWTHLSNLKKEAKKFRTRSEFKTKSSYAYNSALRMGVIDEICGHMESPIKKHGFWNKFDECKKAALKYKSKMEFAKNEPGAYRSALRNGFLNEICLHMK
jgi:hypothetical protein